ncbi:hypothetical protein Vafri_3561 [Volvox africanus]|uniref:Protein kinase domain-containing protein n=2 Tax=Volvox africanus TaxID=51714 RepID=A0A8J4ASH3_9CHLO|nr:hypothetical protein Vafri_3561 [Volvox africanus]
MTCNIPSQHPHTRRCIRQRITCIPKPCATGSMLQIRLGNRVVLRFQSLVVSNYRLGNHNQAPGLDILSPCTPGTSAVVEVADTAGVHRVCYPPKIQEISLASVKRPASIPGNQSYHAYLTQPGCTNETSARPLERCWPHRGLYDDVAMLGADPKDYNLVQLNGYIVHLIRVVYLCELMLSEDCVANMTALGCATFTYATLNPPWRPLAQGRSPPTSQIEVAAAVVPAVQHSTATAEERPGGLSTAQKGAIIGSVVGGLAVMSLAAVLVILRRRRMRRAAGEEPPSTSGSQWRGLAPWDCIRLSVPDDPESAAIRRHLGVVHIPASNVTSSVQSADAVEAGPEAKVAANVSRAKGKTVLAAVSAGGASISVESPSVNGPSQRQPSDTGSTRDTLTAAAIDGLGLAQRPRPAAATAAAATGAAPTTSAMATHGGWSVPDDDDGSSEATGGTQRGGPHDSRLAGWMAIAAAEATAASGDSVRGVLVTPLTPHRPDVNLNLVPGRLQPQHHLRQQQEHSHEGVNANILENFTPEQAAANTVQGTGTEGPRPSAANSFTSRARGPPCTAATAEVVLLPTVRGKGSFGRVVEGMYQGQKVAVKLMNEGLAPVSISNERLLRSFTQEVEVLARCCHPNVVRLLAACVTPPSLCLVMELMDTSLEQLIQRAPGHLLPMSTVLQIAVDVARGLEYLHPTIVHRDLKPANVLVNDPLGPKQVAKLSDFGLARLHCSELRTTNPEAGTVRVMVG